MSVYLGARLLGAGRPAAGATALMSPLLVSTTGIGYEQHAYVWAGFGVWTQLWASMTLPLAWGFSWRAIRHGRDLLPAVVFVSLTSPTALAAIGLALACARWRDDPTGRALVVALAGCLLLSFGRTTFGSLVGAIPGSGDIFFRRFTMGAQLAALLLAGRGAAALPFPRKLRSRAAVAALAAIVLAPAWRELRSFDRLNAAHIVAQRRADATQGADVDRLISLIESGGGGRTYAGTPSNWGADFTVGAVPVFKYLESADVDEVGYTLRTASLMTGPEDHFDELDPTDYALFGIRYLILPAGSSPPVPAMLAATAGPYALWTTGTGGYVHAGTIVGSLAADRTDLGARTAALLRSRLAESGDYLEIDFGRRGPGASPLPRPSRQATAGEVTSEYDDLERGVVTATVTIRRPGVVVLSASFDDGWTATVDGHRRPTIMVAPALVAADVPAGTHTIAFRYRGYTGYPELCALCALTLAAFAFRTRLASCRGARSCRRPWRHTATWRRPTRRRTPPGAQAGS